MLPEAEQTMLKHPISPHPPPPMQFHTPQGAIIAFEQHQANPVIFSSYQNSEVANGYAEDRDAEIEYAYPLVIIFASNSYLIVNTLAEDLERNQPRAKSPHMDNEEPIELAHYPPARVPEPGEVPAIGSANYNQV